MQQFEQQITSYWPNLRPLPAHEVVACVLPQSAKEFLTDVGLPVGDSDLSDYIRVSFYEPDQIHCVGHLGTDYLAIGELSFTKLCLQSETGEVFSIEEGEEPSYVNADIQTFLSFAEGYIEMCKQAATSSDEQWLEGLRRLKKDFKRQDAHAIEDGHYWHEILWEQENMASGGNIEED